MRTLIEMGVISFCVVGGVIYFYLGLKASFEQAKMNRKLRIVKKKTLPKKYMRRIK